MERIEFNALTNISKGIMIEPIKLIEYAISLGQKGIAITDFMNVGAFPKVYRYIKDNNISNFKVIYGVKIKVIVNESLITINVIVKNKVGLKNLYKIISLISKNKYMGIKRDELVKLGDGLLYGLDLNKMLDIYDNLSNDDIKRDMMWYDYLFIRPCDKIYHNRIKELIDIAKNSRKIVIGTGEVCYLKKENKSNYKERNLDATYLKTTKEMLEDFSFLGSDTSYEIVVKNTNLLNSLISNIEIFDDKLYLPEINDSKKALIENVYCRAKAIYGDKLPCEVSDRINLELYGRSFRKDKGIIGSNYEVIFLIYKKLVSLTQVNYPIMERGKVGSSLIAYLLGITNINPLKPHYYCKHCSKFYFEDKYETFRDMPDKICKCGKKLLKNGYNIPIETYLDYDISKMPVININFPLEVKEDLEKILKDMFPDASLIKAGDYNSKYNKWGIHPGSIMIIPKNFEIEDFTPIAYLNENLKATYFDYHDLNKNILKIDFLYHDIPSILKKLKDSTNITPSLLFTDYKDVYEYLNTTSNVIIQKLEPKTFYDYVKIFGLYHAPTLLNKYLKLIESKKITLKDIIITREDFYNYLLTLNIDSKEALEISKSLGKNNMDNLKKYDIKSYYFDIFESCPFLLPKAHLISYTNNYLKIIWYMIHYEKEFNDCKIDKCII